ncbi:hypothetical protein [Mycoplasmopsis bovirhinis]|nr:hypothetical protein [Mycoplasmopsis bovirhinis]
MEYKAEKGGKYRYTTTNHIPLNYFAGDLLVAVAHVLEDGDEK